MYTLAWNISSNAKVKWNLIGFSFSSWALVQPRIIIKIARTQSSNVKDVVASKHLLLSIHSHRITTSISLIKKITQCFPYFKHVLCIVPCSYLPSIILMRHVYILGVILFYFSNWIVFYSWVCRFQFVNIYKFQYFHFIDMEIRSLQTFDGMNQNNIIQEYVCRWLYTSSSFLIRSSTTKEDSFFAKHPCNHLHC